MSRPKPTFSLSHVRVKRGKETYFVKVDLENGATAVELRSKTADMMGVQLSQLSLCVLSEHRDKNAFHELRDDEKLSDQNIANDCVICARLRKDDSAWESPSVVEPPPIEPDMPTRPFKPKP